MRGLRNVLPSPDASGLLFSIEKKVNKNSCRLPSAFEHFHHQIDVCTNLANVSTTS